MIHDVGVVGHRWNERDEEWYATCSCGWSTPWVTRHAETSWISAVDHVWPWVPTLHGSMLVVWIEWLCNMVVDDGR